MRSMVREPIFHFALLAVVLFIYFQTTTESEPIEPEDNVVRIAPADVTLLIEQYKSAWARQPTRQELDGLIQSRIREEVLVREALALGLDSGDSVIRNRLRQKMQFLTDSAAQALTPEMSVLQAHLEANSDRFEKPGVMGFEQVFLGENPTQDEIEAALTALQGGVDPLSVGKASLLPAIVPASVPIQIDGGFGRGFSDTLRTLPVGEWTGPVQSGFGLHLVRLTERKPARLPELSAVEDKVLFDWRREQADALSKAQYEALLSVYEVQTPSGDELNQLVSQ